MPKPSPTPSQGIASPAWRPVQCWRPTPPHTFPRAEVEGTRKRRVAKVTKEMLSTSEPLSCWETVALWPTPPRTEGCRLRPLQQLAWSGRSCGGTKVPHLHTAAGGCGAGARAAGAAQAPHWETPARVIGSTWGGGPDSQPSRIHRVPGQRVCWAVALKKPSLAAPGLEAGETTTTHHPRRGADS